MDSGFRVALNQFRCEHEKIIPIIATLMTATINITNDTQKRSRSDENHMQEPPKKVYDRIGRSWTQRKQGDLKPTDFTWWNFIHEDDIADVNSRNGKVIF